MREDEIYVITKKWFKQKGFIAIAGQPPNGCDNIPTIEIKDILNHNKGSKGAYKPDLVFANEDNIIIVECKPLHDDDDEKKLLGILENNSRISLLYEELTQRNIFKRRKIEKFYSNLTSFEKKIKLCLAHAGEYKLMEKINTLCINSKSHNCDLKSSINLNYHILI